MANPRDLYSSGWIIDSVKDPIVATAKGPQAA